MSPGAIRQYIADGNLRCIKAGRSIKIDARVLEAVICTVDNSCRITALLTAKLILQLHQRRQELVPRQHRFDA